MWRGDPTQSPREANSKRERQTAPRLSHYFVLIMSTNARIGIRTKHGIVSCYHHWDGYPQWLGTMLEKHYTTTESVTELIDGGDMSSCWTNAGWNNETLPESGPLYYTMRGESIEENAPKFAESLTEYLEHCENCGAEFAYLFVLGEWICYDSSRNVGAIVDIPSSSAV